jgi:anthranilate phosphoribosyltransferase
VIEECGFCFLFAQRFHPAMRHVGGARREIGIRTAFNLLGPLSNPAKPKRQLVGVGAPPLGPLVARALALRGMERAIVVHSADGLDEISPATTTRAWIVGEGAVAEHELRPTDFDLPEHALERVMGGTPEHNAGLLQAVVDGADGPVTDFVLMNASAALFAAGIASSFPEGTQVAREAIASGRAREVLDRYIALTQELAGE